MKEINLKLQKDFLNLITKDKNKITNYKSCCAEFSGLWLNTLNITDLGLTMSSHIFRNAFNFYFRFLINKKDKLCKVCKISTNDKFGSHALNCGKTGNKNSIQSRHTSLKATLGQIAREAGYIVVIEEDNIITNSKDRPGDIVIHNYQGALDVCIDVTICNGYNSLSDNFETKDVHKYLDAAVSKKNIKYLEAVRRENKLFEVFALDTFGAFHENAVILIKKIGYKWGLARRTEYGIAKYQIAQRLAFAVMKEVGYSLEDRKDDKEELDESLLNQGFSNESLG